MLIDDLVLAIKHLFLSKKFGTYNIGTTEPYTRYEWAKLIAKLTENDFSVLKPVNKAEYNKTRPIDVLLDTTKLRNTGFTPVSLEEGTQTLLKQMEAQK